MTDNTQPEALRLAERMSSNTGHVGGPTMDATAAELRRQHARIAELEAQLSAIGAGGVSGPLMGRTDSKERAGRTADPLRAAKEKMLRAIEAQPDDGWRVLFAQVAGILKCLPSSFLDGNAHVLRQAKLMADQYRAPDECQQCFGSGEVFEHAEDCADDHCALNGDEHSCVGVVRPCSCQTSAAQARASLAASAGSEPVAWQYRSVRDKGLWFDCTEERAKQRAAHPDKWDVRYLYTHPSPPEGMAGGWISVDERLPEPNVEVLCAGQGWGNPFVTACYYDDERREWYPVNTHWTDSTGSAQYPTHWMPLPPPPTTSAGSGKGK